jgi:tRNA threonylcarbamoyladenosine biosynthesis protein TsaB
MHQTIHHLFFTFHCMPTILAIETSTELASVALLRAEKAISRESRGAQTHSMTVLGLVQELITEAGITLSACDAIAFGSGPGSFTGARTACGLAQGLAFGAKLPVIPIVTLLAMAEAARNQVHAQHVIAVLDARMAEVYSAEYEFDAVHSQEWKMIAEPALSAAAEVEINPSAIVCGNGLTAYATDFQHLNQSQCYPAIMPHASEIAQLAARAWLRKEYCHPRDASPLYLRNKVALTTSERLAGAQK